MILFMIVGLLNASTWSYRQNSDQNDLEIEKVNITISEILKIVKNHRG